MGRNEQEPEATLEEEALEVMWSHCLEQRSGALRPHLTGQGGRTHGFTETGGCRKEFSVLFCFLLTSCSCFLRNGALFTRQRVRSIMKLDQKSKVKKAEGRVSEFHLRTR
jgi:hypothetical protein